MQIIDIHTHITPNVDDGSRSIEMSLQMLRSIVAQGGSKVFLTSHSSAFIWGGLENAKRTYKQMKEIQEKARQEGIPVSLYQGCEIYTRPGYMENILSDLENRILPSMNQTRYIMAEFSVSRGDMEDACFCLEQYLENGWIPIIAHAERYCRTFTTVENIRILKKMGCLVQVNLFDLKQEPNDEIRGCAQELLRAELIDMVGSDAHRMNHRKPELEQGAQYILEHCRTEYAEAVLWRNAETYILQPHILQPQRSGNHQR